MIKSSKELEKVPLTLLLMTKKTLFMKGVRFFFVSMKGNLLSTKNPDKTLKCHISMSRRKGNPIYAKIPGSKNVR
jgi:hypothetical protein